jgi:hypothetical protein
MPLFAQVEFGNRDFLFWTLGTPALCLIHLLRTFQIPFQAVHPFFDIFHGIGVTEPEVSLGV